jgi:4-hydroxythreonine-4-phosphate dehydrogenase
MLIVTLGDPHSTTVELLAPLLPAVVRELPVVLVGAVWHWRDQLTRLGSRAPTARPLASLAEPPTAPGLYMLDSGGAEKPAESLSPQERGLISLKALEALSALPTMKRLAVVTAPIDKAACHAAGYRLGGQTEYFEELWDGDAVMTLAGPRLRVGLVTNHMPLAHVSATLTPGLVTSKALRFAATLQQIFGIAAPRVAVCGLNPHAGDGGLFGDEDARVIAPAVAAASAQATGTTFAGPLPADTVFYRGYHGAYDGVLAMYHDQGLGPLKTVHFDDAVNVSGGLRHLRVSPDHGPARDLFLARRASGASWSAALALALKYLKAAL